MQTKLSEAKEHISSLNEEAIRTRTELSEAKKHKSSLDSQIERMRGVEKELREKLVRADESISRLKEQVREARTLAETEKTKAEEQARKAENIQNHADMSRTELTERIDELSTALQQQHQMAQAAIQDSGELAWKNELHKETIANQQRDIGTATNHNEQLAEEIRGLQDALEDAQRHNKSANSELDAAKTAARRALERANEVKQSLNTAKETHAARVVTFRDEVITLQDKLAITEKELLEAKARDAKQTQAAGERIRGLTNKLEQLKESKVADGKQHTLQLEQKDAQFKDKADLLENRLHAANSELEQLKQLRIADEKEYAFQLKQKDAQFKEEANLLETRFRAANSNLEKCIQDLQSQLKDTIQKHQTKIFKMSESAISERTQLTDEKLQLERSVADSSDDIVALTGQLQELESRAENLEETCHEYAAREDELNSKLRDLDQGLKKADNELRAKQDELFQAKAQAQHAIEQVHQKSRQSQEDMAFKFEERLKLSADEISELKQMIGVWESKEQAWAKKEKDLMLYLRLTCRKNVQNSRRIHNLEHWMREFARGGIANAQVIHTLEHENSELQQRFTDLEAELSIKRRGLGTIVCAREDLVRALYERLSIVPPDLGENYVSREALNAANACYINLLNRLVGYWKETRELLEARNSDVARLYECLRTALDTVWKHKGQIEELEESRHGLKNMFEKFIDTATENSESVNLFLIRLRDVMTVLAGDEEEETASQEAE